MKDKNTAKNIMQTEVAFLRPEDSLKVAWNLFRRNNISGAPVVDEEGTLVGIISQVDLLRELFDSHKETSLSPFCQGMPYIEGEFFTPANELEEITVDAAMHQGVVTVTEDQDISSVAKLMFEQHVHRVVVVNDIIQRKVLGIISSLDLVRLLA